MLERKEIFMDLTSLTEDEFLCSDNRTLLPADPHAFENIRDLLSSMIGPCIRSLGSGYAVHHVSNQLGDVVLIYQGKPIGGYLGELLAIDDAHKGKALSVPMVISAVPNRQLPLQRKVSDAGLAALRKSWRVANSIEQNPWP